MNRNQMAKDYLKRFIPNKKDAISARLKSSSRRILIALDSLADDAIVISPDSSDDIHEEIENHPIIKHAESFEKGYKVSRFLPDYFESVIDNISGQRSNDDFLPLLERAAGIISLVGGMVANKEMETFFSDERMELYNIAVN